MAAFPTADAFEADTLRRCIAKRMSTREIAAELGWSQHTVKARLRRHGLSTEYRAADPDKPRKKPGVPVGTKLARQVEPPPVAVTPVVSPRSIREYEQAGERERALFAPHVVAAAQRLGVG